MNAIIKVENISKLYKIGAKESYGSLRDEIMQTITAPFRRLKPNTSNLTPDTDTNLWALKDVSFEVNEGEVIGIIGRNGAGKSTLLKIFSRITEPTSGRVVMRGRVASLLEVGTGFHPELTGRENIFLNGSLLGMTNAEIKSKFDDIVAFSEIEKFLDTPVKRYSSGMYVRLAFAVAAHLEPEILIIDEILAVGDTEFQKKCMGKMEDVGREGRTVLFVSHNMAAVERLCNRAILLHNGKIASDNSASRVISDYLRAGVMEFGERVWSNIGMAPGDDVVRLRAVRAFNRKGQVTSEFKVSEPFYLEIEFLVLQSGILLDAGFKFLNDAGNVIFQTADFQDNHWYKRPRPAGIHRSTCHIPENLLNQGSIRVFVFIVTNPHTAHAVEGDAIALRIIDDHEPGGARGHYTEEWTEGVVRPLFRWTFDYMPNTDSVVKSF